MEMQAGSRSIREAILRIGCRPVDAARAEEVRSQLGLAPEAEVTHYDSLAAAGWAKAEAAGKDWALFLRDTSGENPSQAAKNGFSGFSGVFSTPGLFSSGDNAAAERIRPEDLSALSDEELRALLLALCAEASGFSGASDSSSEEPNAVTPENAKNAEIPPMPIPKECPSEYSQ